MGRSHLQTSRLTGFLGLSLILHLNLILLIAVSISLSPDGCRGASQLPITPFEVSLVPQKDVQPVDPQLEELKKEELKKEEEKDKDKEKDIKGQVVEIAPPKEEKQPDKAKYLSEYDSKVAKETKGPAVPFKPGRMVANRPLPEVQPRPATPQQQQEIERKVMKLAMRREAELPRSELPKTPTGDEAERNRQVQQPRPEPRPQAETPAPTPPSPSQKRKLTMKDLQLSDEELGRAVGSPVNDYLKDIEEGSQTLLNTKRWRFATFFNRVKRQVAQNWHPDVVYRRRDPSGNVYGFRDRLTVLRVHLTPQGRLKELHLEKPCGVAFLDDEAMAAFKAAEPFPNPPPGLVDKETGIISFRFGFLFEISSRPGFRIFRSAD